MSPELVSDIGRWLTSIIVPVVIGGLLYAARRQAKVRIHDARLVVEYGWGMRGFGLFAVLFAGFMVFIATRAKPEEQIMAAAVSGGFVLLAIILAVEVFRVRVEFDAESVRCFSPWRRNRVIPWEAVDTITYSQMNQWWVVRTKGGAHGSVRLSQFLTGVADFVVAAQARGVAVDGPLPAPPVPRVK